MADQVSLPDAARRTAHERFLASQLAIIQDALVNAETECRYHQQRWDFLGREWPGGPPRCDSCKQPWRVQRALNAVDAIARSGRPSTEETTA